MRVFALCALLALLPGTVAADGPGPGAGVPHVLRWSASEDIFGLNPVLSQQGVVTWLGQLTMAWLFRFDRENRPVPELATVLPTKANGGVSADGKTITLHLRRNVKWSDGQPFDADDVVFTLNAMNNPANNIASRNGFDRIVKLDEPDKATVIIHLRAPYSPLLPLFAPAGGSPCVLPKHVLGSLPDINQAPYNSLPVGIGPFRYTVWRRGDAVEMEANPYYWRGLPKLKKIIYKIIPDRNTTFTQLQTGEIDLMFPTSGAFLPRLQALSGVSLLRHPSFIFNHLDLNTARPALQDVAVRQALRLALDRAALRQKIGHGAGILQESPIPAPYPDVAPLPLVPYRPDEANAVLDRAGWVRGPDGVRVKNGVRLSLEFASTSGSPDVDQQLELIRFWWQQIGVEMTIKRYDASLMFAPLAAGGILYGGKFDVIAFATGVSLPSNMSIAYGCGMAPPKGQNFTHYCNPKLEPLFADFLNRYDSAGQGADLSKIARTLSQDVPTIVTTSREDIFAYRSSLANFHPNNISPFDDMLQVDL